MISDLVGRFFFFCPQIPPLLFSRPSVTHPGQSWMAARSFIRPRRGALKFPGR